jgi:DNA-binding NtrC family response regulator
VRNLYYPLNVVPDEHPAAAGAPRGHSAARRTFCQERCPRFGSRVESLTEAAIQKLLATTGRATCANWKKRDRTQLGAVHGTKLDADDIKLDLSPRARPANSVEAFLPEGMTLDTYEQALIREALRRAEGNKSQAARLLGLTRNALRYRLSQMGLEA